MESIYKVIELVGTSKESWEDAIKNVVATASKTIKDIRVVDIKKLDVRVDEGNVLFFRVRVKLSFKYKTD